MVFKNEDICVWFKNLEGHARIELICTLLDTCLPLELRFIGTYLEYFAGKHYSHLQKWEKDANNNNVIDNSTDLMDQVTRRRLCIFLALLHSHNRVTATKFYMLLKSFEKLNIIQPCSKQESEVQNLSVFHENLHLSNTRSKPEETDHSENKSDNCTDEQEKFDILSLNNEMKLLLTMASYHPAFEFWQRENMRDRLKTYVKDSYENSCSNNKKDHVDSSDTILITTKHSPPPQISSSIVTQVSKPPLLPSPSTPIVGLTPSFLEPFSYPGAAGVRPGNLPPSLMIPTPPIHMVAQQNGPILNQNNIVQLPNDEKQTPQLLPIGAENIDLRNIVLTPMTLHLNQPASQFNTHVKPVTNYIVSGDSYCPPLMNDLTKIIPNGPISTPVITSISNETCQHKVYPTPSIADEKLNFYSRESYKSKHGSERRCMSESEMYTREEVVQETFHTNETIIDGMNNAIQSSAPLISSSKNNIRNNKPVVHQFVQNFHNVHAYQVVMPQNKFMQPTFVQSANLNTNKSNVQTNLIPHSIPVFPLNSNMEKSSVGNLPLAPMNNNLLPNPSKGSLPAHLDVIQTFDPLKPTHLIPSPLYPVATTAANVVYPPPRKDSGGSMKGVDEKDMMSGTTIPTGINGGYISRQMLLNGPVTPVKSFRKESMEEKIIISSGFFPTVSSTLDKPIIAASSFLNVEKISPAENTYLHPSPKASPISSPCQSPSTQRRGSQPKEIPNLSSTTDWLKSLRLHKYEENFRDYTFQMMAQLDEDSLIKSGLTKGARTKLLQHIDMLRKRGFKEFGQPINHTFTSEFQSPLPMSPSATPSDILASSQNPNFDSYSSNELFAKYAVPTTLSDSSTSLSDIITHASRSDLKNEKSNHRSKDTHISQPSVNDSHTSKEQNVYSSDKRLHGPATTEYAAANHYVPQVLTNHVDEDHMTSSFDDEVFSIPPAATTKKKNSLSATCYNCGLVGHYGDECTEQTMEAQTFIRYAFHLDYSNKHIENVTSPPTESKSTNDETTVDTEIVNTSVPPR